MTTIDEFIEAETNKMNWLDKVVRNYPEVQKTSFLSPALKQSKPQVVIKPSVMGQLTTIVFLLFSLIFYFLLINILIHGTLPVPIPIGGLLFVSFLVYLLIWYSFLNPNYIYKIFINKNYIQAGKKIFLWKEIMETCILTKMEGRYSNSYLVIFLWSGATEKLNLYKFYISKKRLSGIIEFYKHQNEDNKLSNEP